MGDSDKRQAGAEIEVTPEMVERAAVYPSNSGSFSAHGVIVNGSLHLMVKGLFRETLSQKPYRPKRQFYS